MLERLWTDARYAVRWLWRSPGFTVVAVASLAVGIGLNTALFAVVDAVLFRPLPVQRPDRLVDVYTSQRDGEAYGTSSYPDYLDFKARNRVFTDVLAYSLSLDAIGVRGRSRLAIGEVVTGNYFQLLGLHAVVGRLLTPDDDRPGAPRVVVISYKLWARQYAGNPATVGQVLLIHGEPYTIVGVAPRTYNGAFPVLSAEVWMPMARIDDTSPAGIIDTVPSPTGTGPLDRRGYRWLFVKGRLTPSETVDRAGANMALLMRQLATAYPQTNGDRRTAVVRTDRVRILPQADRMLMPVALGLMLVVGLVLLTACANVASMLLARASSRQREIGIRLAVGASRGRLMQQLLTESAVLAVIGAAAGTAVAWAVTRAVTSLELPIPIPLATTVQIDTRVLAFTTLAALVAGLAAGLAPAFKATRPDLVRELKGESAGGRAGGRRWTLRDGLVTAQVAVTMILLVTAGLLTRSLLAAQQIPVGFDTGRLAVVGTDLDLIGYDEPRSRAFFERALERVKALPGVENACLVTRSPFTINYNRNEIFPLDLQRPGARGLEIDATTVSADYFVTLGVPLLRGRLFGPGDTPQSPRVAIVNQAMARKLWRGRDAVGEHFRISSFDGPDVEVVGIVADYRVNTVGEVPTPYVHFAHSQRGDAYQVLARTDGDADALVRDVRRVLQTLEPNVVFIGSQTMETQVGATLLPARFGALTVASVGLVAMLLASVGLYGVIAYSVARRTREIGIRLALGARPSAVLRLVMRQGFGLVATGAGVGALLALGAARAIAAALYGVGFLDPVAWSAALCLVIGVSMLANVVPARRAAGVDPSRALRSE